MVRPQEIINSNLENIIDSKIYQYLLYNFIFVSLFVLYFL